MDEPRSFDTHGLPDATARAIEEAAARLRDAEAEGVPLIIEQCRDRYAAAVASALTGNT